MMAANLSEMGKPSREQAQGIESPHAITIKPIKVGGDSPPPLLGRHPRGIAGFLYRGDNPSIERAIGVSKVGNFLFSPFVQFKAIYLKRLAQLSIG